NSEDEAHDSAKVALSLGGRPRLARLVRVTRREPPRPRNSRRRHMLCNRLPVVIAAVTLGFAAASTHAEGPPKDGQAPGWYRMTLGKFEITALSDGTIRAPVHQLLHNIPLAREKELLEHAHLKSPVETSVNGFLFNTGSKLVLIDCGAAGLFGPTLGKL